MKYQEIKQTIEKMSQDNYRDFVKALISLEKGINDEDLLDEIYDKYMKNDSVMLLNEEFDKMIVETKLKEK